MRTPEQIQQVANALMMELGMIRFQAEHAKRREPEILEELSSLDAEMARSRESSSWRDARDAELERAQSEVQRLLAEVERHKEFAAAAERKSHEILDAVEESPVESPSTTNDPRKTADPIDPKTRSLKEILAGKKLHIDDGKNVFDFVTGDVPAMQAKEARLREAVEKIKSNSKVTTKRRA